jgi:hypothetical protein
MRRCILLFLLIVQTGLAQNKPLLYEFARLPQNVLLNPGAELTAHWYAGVPLLSSIHAEGGFSEFTVYDIFADDDVDINDKLREAVADYGSKGLLIANQQWEVISGGFRLKNNGFLSLGFYQEADMLIKVPKDLVDLFYEGNSVIDRRYDIRKLAGRADLLGVLHVGLSKKVSKKLNLGGRIKLYSGALNAYSSGNRGILYTTIGSENLYRQHLDYIDFLFQSSGLFYEADEEPEVRDFRKKVMLGGNLGLGVDFGFTYYPKKQWSISGAVRDLGFMNHKDQIKSYKLKGDFEVEGMQLLYNPESHDDYWNDLDEEFRNDVEHETLEDKYATLRPVKLNAAFKYGFGRPYYDDCRYQTEQETYNNNLGVQLFSVVGAVHSYLSGTLFYDKRISKGLHTRIALTADPFSWTNVGLGLATYFGPVNAYVTAENLLHLDNIYDARAMRLSFGINVVLNR